MCHHNKLRRVVAVGVIAWCTAAVAGADTQVSIAFELADAELAGHFAPDRAGAEREFARSITDALNRDATLRFWKFFEGTGSPHLQIQVVKNSLREWLFKTTLTDAAGVSVDDPWTTSWMTEADLDARFGWGPLAQLKALIVERFRERVIAPQRDDILHRLQRIPLIAAARLIDTSPRPRVIVPLDWTQYGDLSASDFRLDYRTPTGVLSVFGDGVQMPGRYPMPPPSRGLTLQLMSCKIGSAPEDLRRHLSEIRTAQPIGVFLSTYIAVPGGPLPAPSVAVESRE